MNVSKFRITDTMEISEAARLALSKQLGAEGLIKMADVRAHFDKLVKERLGELHANGVEEYEKEQAERRAAAEARIAEQEAKLQERMEQLQKQKAAIAGGETKTKGKKKSA